MTVDLPGPGGGADDPHVEAHRAVLHAIGFDDEELDDLAAQTAANAAEIAATLPTN